MYKSKLIDYINVKLNSQITLNFRLSLYVLNPG